MRIVLADLDGTDGFVSKDTVAGGFGSRFIPFSRVTRVIYYMKRRYHEMPSMQMAYLAAIASTAGHEVLWTRDEFIDGDVAIVLSSLVDFRHEIAWADAMRTRGVRVGFIGLAASKIPDIFAEHADFVIMGEPESAMRRLVQGEKLSGLCESEPIENLNTLPFPRWDLVLDGYRQRSLSFSARAVGGGFPLQTSRGCREFCTYCPHRILAGYRSRSIQSVINELEQLCDRFRRPQVKFRDPVFTEDRDRCLAICDEIQARGLDLRFECETRLDRVDTDLLDKMYKAGLRVLSFGVESVSAESLSRVGRRPVPEAHQRSLVEYCRRRGILTAAFYILGLLDDDWTSISATIDFACDLGSTLAQFKLLTPYPGTPFWKQVEPLVYEKDWQKFDGFTPTFKHPNLTATELKFLLGAAYTHFYMRPSYLANYLKIHNTHVRQVIGKMDDKVIALHAHYEIQHMSRPVTC